MALTLQRSPGFQLNIEDSGSVEARFFRLTFPGDKILLIVGPGDHTAQVWELTQDQLRGLVLDAMPKLLR